MTETVKQDLAHIVEQLADIGGELNGKTVFVSGATGMVGQYVVKSLLEMSKVLPEANGLRVIASFRDVSKGQEIFGEYQTAPNFSVALGDITEVDLSQLQDIDFIVHAASPASPKYFKEEPVGVIKANVEGTWRLLELARETGASFCFISTMEIYGELEQSEGVRYVTEEDYGAVDTLELRSAYPESKRLAENLCVAFGEQYGVPSSLARLSHTYGPGMGLDDGRVQADFIKKALKNEPIVLLSDGTSRRTYTYIADATTAILRIMLEAKTKPTAFNIANSAAEVSIRELAETILEETGHEKTELLIQPQNADPLWNRATGKVVVDSGKLISTGWAPLFGVSEGILRTVAHHRELMAE